MYHGACGHHGVRHESQRVAFVLHRDRVAGHRRRRRDGIGYTDTGRVRTWWRNACYLQRVKVSPPSEIAPVQVLNDSHSNSVAQSRRHRCGVFFHTRSISTRCMCLSRRHPTAIFIGILTRHLCPCCSPRAARLTLPRLRALLLAVLDEHWRVRGVTAQFPPACRRAVPPGGAPPPINEYRTAPGVCARLDAC